MADLTQFDVRSARRIASVVQAVEQEPRRAKPLVFGAIPDSGNKRVFRICTFTGSWSIGSAKTVTFKNQTTTPNTVAATNLFWPLPDGPQRDCSIAKDGTAWYLLVPQLEAGTALSSVTLGGSLEFGQINVISLGTASTVAISTTTCAVDISA